MKIKSFKPTQQQVQDARVQSQSGQPSAGVLNPGATIRQDYSKQTQKQDFGRRDSQNQNAPSRPAVSSNSNAIRLIPLGGVGDVTKNMFVYEYKDDIVIIDCGVSFPDEGMLGVDLVIPDITYLRDKKEKIRGIIITHGHDDHYGALPYIWPELNVPIYSQKFTCGLIRAKFADHKITTDKINVLDINATLKLGAFNISFYQVSHSVPDSTGIVLETPVGTTIHQSDFKIDWTPVNGQVTDVGRVAELGKKGLMFMTIDCLRVEKPGYTLSEKTIEPTFSAIEQETKGKLLITTITSNITRIQQAVNVAVKSGRKLAFAGRSMENNVQVARDLGYLNVPANLIIAQDEIKRFADEKLLIVIAGSLGQVGSALSRVANNDHKFIRISKNDTVVFSSDPMPSAEYSQSALIDEISRFGCRVYYSALDSDLHVSGHAAREELKLMLNLAKPKFLMPVGGSFKHVKAFVNMALDLGYKENQILAPTEVVAMEIAQDHAKYLEKIPNQNVYVDGLGVGDVGSIILRDRQVMSEEGVVVVIVPIDKANGRVSGQPDIISRGFIFEGDNQDIIEAGKEIVKSCLSEHGTGHIDLRYARHSIEENLKKFFYQETKRSPLILTVVVEV